MGSDIIGCFTLILNGKFSLYLSQQEGRSDPRINVQSSTSCGFGERSSVLLKDTTTVSCMHGILSLMVHVLDLKEIYAQHVLNVIVLNASDRKRNLSLNTKILPTVLRGKRQNVDKHGLHGVHYQGKHLHYLCLSFQPHVVLASFTLSSFIPSASANMETKTYTIK